MDEAASVYMALIKSLETLALSGYSLTSRILCGDLSTDDISFLKAFIRKFFPEKET